VIRLSRARLAQFLTALAVLIGALTFSSGAAQAASVNGAFSGIVVTSTSGTGPIHPWDEVKVTADWAVPDHSAAGTTFSLSWPVAQLSGLGGTMTLKNPADGGSVATCVLGTASLDCTLLSYVTSHPLNIKGSVWFTLTQVNAISNTTITVPFKAGTTTTTTTYPSTGPGPFNGVQFFKDMYVNPDGTVTWYVYLPAGVKGATKDYLNVVVEDSMSGGQTIVPGSIRLEHATKLYGDGSWPQYAQASASLFTVQATSKSFVLKAPQLAGVGWWRIAYEATAKGYKGQLTNTASATWDCQTKITTMTTEIYSDYGGVGSGEFKAVSVGDTVWWDENHNGIQDESLGHGIAGAVLTLTGPSGPVTDVNGNAVTPITTDANGHYDFVNLPVLAAGERYSVTVTPPAGYVPTTPHVGADRAVDSSTGSETSASLTTNGASDMTLDFGFVKGAVSVGDFVWFDSNRNGLQDDGSASGLPGVKMTLTGPDGKGVTDLSGSPVAPTTTDAAGKYLFSNLPVLPAGQHYTVTVTPPTGYTATTPNAGSDRALDSSTGSAASGDLVTDGAKDLTLDFGFVKGAVSVGDYVWLDTNRNGLQDTGEKGIAGVTLTLTGPDGKPVTDLSGAEVAPTTTNASGKYLFSNLPTLPAGQHYTVTVTPPAGYVSTLPTIGSDRTVDSSTGSATSGDLVNNGDKDLTLDFGFTKLTVSVGDYVWIDSNNNGLQDPGEPGLAGATLTLTGPDGKPVTDINGNPVAHVTTPASGAYLFSNLPTLPAGQHYTVTVTPPAGFAPTLANAGMDPAVDSSTGSATSGDLVNNGDKDLTLDFGFTKIVVSVGDRVWLDTNRDGLQTTGEPGIPGVTVKLLKGGVVVATTTTDSSGYYGFGDLDPSAPYTVQFVPPTGMTVTTKDAGGDSSNSPTSDLTDSDAGPDGLVAFTTPPNGTNSTVATKADNPGIDLGLVSQINLVLSKTIVTKGPVRNGAELTYTLTPHNDGPVTALAGWSVTDVLPSSMTLVSISGAGYTCSTTDPTKPVCVASAGLAPGTDGAVITVVTKVTVDYGSLKNVAYVSPAPGDVPETNPLVVPALTTDTSTSPTDNDAQATIDVASPVSVGDYVWWDVNRDGLQSADEPAVPGVKVTLQDAEGNVLDTTVTDAKGYYAFAGLIPGARYQIVFTAPTGATFTTANVGNDKAIDSDAPATGKVAFVAPLSGANETAPGKADLPTIDAGLVKLNLSITKKVTSTGPYYASGNVTYSLVPHNDGPVDALAGWSVTEVLPEGSVLIGLSGDGYVCLTNLVCTSSDTLSAGADGKPITAIVQIPEGVTGPFKNVAYVSPSPKEITETNPLVIPTISTDTASTPTDNDAEGVVTVSPPQEEGIVITIPNTGATIPLTWFLGAIGLLAAGLILVGASRVGARSRKN
jgi:uncharacterized repeat protein (TIGR01451 family)